MNLLQLQQQKIEQYKNIDPSKYLQIPLVRAEIWDKTGGKCWYCGKQTNPFKKEFCIDHLIPRSAGGSDDIENLVPSCTNCNCSKNNLGLELFRKRQSNKTGIVFSDEQIEYLKTMEVILPEKEYLFYFEKVGLK
jgi:5-methylcytosine-specific restriction endonuclease McrA